MIPRHQPHRWFTSNRSKLQHSKPASGSADPAVVLRGELDQDNVETKAGDARC